MNQPPPAPPSDDRLTLLVWAAACAVVTVAGIVAVYASSSWLFDPARVAIAATFGAVVLTVGGAVLAGGGLTLFAIAVWLAVREFRKAAAVPR